MVESHVSVNGPDTEHCKLVVIDTITGGISIGHTGEASRSLVDPVFEDRVIEVAIRESSNLETVLA